MDNWLAERAMLDENRSKTQHICTYICGKLPKIEVKHNTYIHM
jgi:hypothetical protein